jgi:hypothetical protein
MTSDTVQAGLTARNLLLGSGLEDDTAALRQALSEHNVLDAVGGKLSRLTGDGREAANDALASACAGLLDLDLGDVLIYAWRTQERLADAARETLRAPGRREIVQLASHQVTSTYNPAVDLMVDGVRVHTFHFQLDLVLTIDVAAVIVRNGRLVAVKAGDGSVSGTLTLKMPGGDATLLHQEQQIDLHLLIRVGNGIPLPPRGEKPATATGLSAAGRDPGGWPGWASYIRRRGA